MSLSYEHITSRRAHGVITDNVYERLIEADREIWIASDGSGLIKTTTIRWSFFTEQQRARWAAVAHSPNAESLEPTYYPFGPGGLSGSRRRLSKLPTDPAELVPHLEARNSLSLHSIADFMGETFVPQRLRQTLYQIAVSLPGAEEVQTSRDVLGRTGIGVAREEARFRNRPGWRIELTFGNDSLELLGCRQILVDDDPGFARAGALVDWSSYLNREIADQLPREAPAPVPRH